jgi:hypothetical protein
MVVAETPGYVSRPMIKFAVNIPPESICTVFGVVKRTSEKIQSTTIQDLNFKRGEFTSFLKHSCRYHYSPRTQKARCLQKTRILLRKSATLNL